MLARFSDVDSLGVYREVTANAGSTTMQKRRVNADIPETIRLTDEFGKYLVREHGRTRLRRLLEEGAARRAARDLAIAEEWFPVDKDAWRKRRR
jgi:hypothetical protein